MKWRPGKNKAQYLEYQRSAENAGCVKCGWNDKSAHLWCIVNPCNPTGEFTPIDDLKTEICGNASAGTYVLVDESMQTWFGPEWRSQSLTSQSEWMGSMSAKGVHVFVVHSWTKIWCCPVSCTRRTRV
eukprot:GHVN01051933.1.p1 GENE.GHVN01051933.1~~GHVN01051933.1.p1  ORF type:complete len:128 (-),score=7.92 GHVN01051933.1:210-593(-)